MSRSLSQGLCAIVGEEPDLTNRNAAMNLPEIRERLDHERRYLARDGETIHVLPNLTRVVCQSHRGVVWSSLEEEAADSQIAEELRNYRDDRAAFEWKLYLHDKPADLLDRLRRHGLVPGGAGSRDGM